LQISCTKIFLLLIIVIMAFLEHFRGSHGHHVICCVTGDAALNQKPSTTRAERKAHLAKIDPRSLTLKELRPFASAFQSKMRKGKPVRERIELPCAGCGRLLSARERRYACPDCGTQNRNLKATKAKGGRS
jgi:hypothetical protein